MRIIAQTYIILSLYLQLHCLVFKALLHRTIFINFYYSILIFYLKILFLSLFPDMPSFLLFILILILLVQSRFRNAMKSRCLQLLSQVFPFFSLNSRTPLSIMKPEISGKLIYIRKSIFNWRKACAEFSVAQNCTTLFFCCPSVSWFDPTPPSATAEMRCEIFNLVYPITTPQQQTPSSVEPFPSNSRSSALPPTIAGSIASYEHPVLLHY